MIELVEETLQQEEKEKLKKFSKKFNYSSKYAVYDSMVRIYLTCKKLNIPEQQIKTLVVFSLFGINEKSENLLVNKNIVPNKRVIRNYKTNLKDLGLIHKIRTNRWEIVEDLIFTENSINIEIKLTCNQS